MTALWQALGAVLIALGAVNATAPAVRTAETVGPPAPPPFVATGRCAQWEQTALDVGWPIEQWPTVDRVMWCESNCQPTARNRSGASGLMQVMPGWWHGRDPFDPATNLTMALEIREAQGWRAWSCYR